MIKGKYIVVEGLRGAGKSTQVELIAKRLKMAGLPVRIVQEPDDKLDAASRAIRKLTRDANYPMTSRTQVLVYNATRAQTLKHIQESLDHGINCVVDRNYLSTLAYQYYADPSMVENYDTINNIIEFAVNEVQPDVTIVLDLPVQQVKERLANSRRLPYLPNDSVLERVRAGYLWEAKQRNLPIVFASGTPEEVLQECWTHVTQALAKRGEQAGEQIQPTLVGDILSHKSPITETEIKKDDLLQKDAAGNYSITPAGQNYLSDLISNPNSNVYAFNDKLSPITIAAAMARLSRRGDDMRVTLLDEFTEDRGKDHDLLKRVITAYGDDSVQQLAGQHLVVENASAILTKKLEWGRLAAYLEQSTRYIYYDQKDANGKYKYFVPDTLKGELKKTYIQTMDGIFERYSLMVKRLLGHIRQESSVPENERDGAWKSATKAQACDVVRGVLPAATQSTVGIFASGQALESLIMHLLSDELPEAREVGKQILAECRKVIPTLLERADKPDRGGATIAYRANTYSKMQKLAQKELADSHSDTTEPVKLVEYWPKNELDLVADMLYEHSNQSLDDIKKTIAKWSYDKRQKVFNTYMGQRLNRRHRPGRALEKAHYSWDLICDFGIFRDLQRHRIVDDLEWQQLTPRFGYEVPEVLEQAGLSDIYEECFDMSLSLHSQMQAAGLGLEAQYATLLAHKMRWKVTYNAREAFHLHELRTSPQGHPNYRKLINLMHEQLAEVHPLLADAMIFVNKDEDPELSRLAAEKYTQYKLSKLDDKSKILKGKQQKSKTQKN